MDKNTIVQGVITLLIMGLGTSIGWLFSSITELQHKVDIMDVHIKQADSELNDIWSNYNEQQRQHSIDGVTFYNYQIEILKDKINRTKE